MYAYIVRVLVHQVCFIPTPTVLHKAHQTIYDTTWESYIQEQGAGPFVPQGPAD
jgi:hypothetical protein